MYSDFSCNMVMPFEKISNASSEVPVSMSALYKPLNVSIPMDMLSSPAENLTGSSVLFTARVEEISPLLSIIPYQGMHEYSMSGSSEKS